VYYLKYEKTYKITSGVYVPPNFFRFLRGLCGVIVYLRSVLRLLVTANVPSLPILVTLMMEAINSSETSILSRAKRRNIPEDGIRRSHRRETLKSYRLDSVVET
jgi:hypothetical protein